MKRQRKRVTWTKGNNHPNRKNTLRRPIALLLVFVMFLGLVPESAAGLIGQAWATGMTGSQLGPVGPMQDDPPTAREIDTSMPAVLGAPKKEDVEEFVKEHDLNVDGALEIDTDGYYYVYSTKKNNSQIDTSITIQDDKKVTIYLDSVNIQVGAGSPMVLGENVELTLVLVDGSISTLANQRTKGGPYSEQVGAGIRLPESSFLNIKDEVGGSGKLTINGGSSCAGIGGNLGKSSAPNDMNSGDVTIDGGNLVISVAPAVNNGGYAAAIGGGSNILSNGKGGDGGIVVINGGTIQAVGSIGGGETGHFGGDGGDHKMTIINGGSLLATNIGGGGTGSTIANSKGGDGGIVEIYDGVISFQSHGVGGGPARAGGASGTGGDGAELLVMGGNVHVSNPFPDPITGLGWSSIRFGGGYTEGGDRSGPDPLHGVDGYHVIRSGDFFVHEPDNIYARFQNGAEYGDDVLRYVTVMVKDHQGSAIGDAKLSVQVKGSNGKIYTYEAATEGAPRYSDHKRPGYAYIWLPESEEEYTIYADHELYGSGSESFTVPVGDDTTFVPITLDTTNLNVTKTPADKTYSPVGLDVTAFNYATSVYVGVEEVLWFRAPEDDETVYTDQNFMTGYNQADDGDKGSSEDVNPVLVEIPQQQETIQRYHMDATENGRYWFMARYLKTDTTYHYMLGKTFVNNIYTITTIGERGWIEGSPYYLYGAENAYEDVKGLYSVPFDLHQDGVLKNPSDGYTKAALTIPESYRKHWRAFLKGNPETELTPTAEISLDPVFYDPQQNQISDDDPRNITVTYRRLDTGDNWRQIEAIFVNETDGEFEVEGRTREQFHAPTNEKGDVDQFLNNGGRYVPPSNSEYYPVGYIVANSYTPGDKYIDCGEFSLQFDPRIPGGANAIDQVYIVYSKDTVAVRERYVVKDTNIEFSTTTTVLEAGEDYQKAPGEVRTFNGYVEVGYEVQGTGISGVDGEFPLDVSALEPDESQHGKLAAFIAGDDLLAATGDVVVTYYYEPELVDDEGGGTGIPKSQGSRVEVRHSGTAVDWEINKEVIDIFETEVRFVRKTTPLSITNDGSDDGKDPYAIPAPNDDFEYGQWIFDNTRPISTGGNEKQEPPLPLRDQEIVTFYYLYDSLGDGTPDRDQYVEEQYIERSEDGTENVFINRLIYVLKGGNYQGKADPFRYDTSTGEPSFILRGIQVDDETAMRPGPEISLDTWNDTHMVQYIYSEAAKLSLKWSGKNYASEYRSNIVDDEFYYGYIDEDVTDLIKEAVHQEFAGWEFVDAWLDDLELIRIANYGDGEGGDPADPDGQFPTLTLTKDPQQLTVNYLEIPNKVYINVYGIMVDEDTQTQRYYIAHEPLEADSPITIPLIQFENYEISRIERETEQGTETLETYPPSNYSLKADPKDGDQTIRIYYENILQEVTVYKRYYYSPDDDVATPETLWKARGESYTATAPFLSGHQLVDEDGESEDTQSVTITVGDTDEDHNNEIYFYYVEAEGMLEIYYVDEETGASLGGRNVKINANEPVVIEPKPDIEHYISLSPNEPVDWNGNAEEFPEAITFKYRRMRTTVTLEAWDQKFERPIALDPEDPEDPLEEARYAEVKDGDVRIYEYYGYEGKALELDDIVLGLEGTVYSAAPRGFGAGIMPKEKDDPDNVVKIWYTPADDSTIMVEVYAEGGEDGYLLYSYPYHGSKGVEVEFDQDYIEEYVVWRGFSLDVNHAENNWKGTIGTRDKIVIILKDDRHTVEVYTNTGSGDVYDHEYKVVNGDKQWVKVPNVPDHLMTSYKVGNELKDGEFKEFETDEIYSSLKVVFYYQASEEIVGNRYVDIVVYGRPLSTSGDPLYQYTKRVEKEDREYQVIADKEVFDLTPQWILRDDQPGKKTFNPSEYQYPINFIYVRNIAPITIYAREYVTGGGNGGAELISSIKIPEWEIGKSYTHQAPTIPGYVVVKRDGSSANGAYSETITVSGDIANEITFYYKKESGNLAVTYVDVDTRELLGKDSITLTAADGIFEVPAPAIPYYDAPTTLDTRQFTGTNDLAPVEYEYTRKEALLTLTAVDWLSGQPLKDAGGVGTLTATTDLSRVMESIAPASKLTAALADLDAQVVAQAETLGNPAYTRITAVNHAIVSDLAAENQLTIYYNPPTAETVTVQIWSQNADGSNRTMLHAYPTPAAKDARVDFPESEAPIFPGYVFRKDLSQLTTVQGSGDPIELVYVDERLKVTVYTQTTALNSQPTQERTIYLTPTEAVNYSLPVLYRVGHVLKSYVKETEDGASAATPWTGAHVPLGTIAKDTDVYLLYETIEEAVNSEISQVTVTGKVVDAASSRNGESLFFYSKRVARTAETGTPVEVVELAELPDLAPTWRLKTGEADQLTFNPSGNKDIILAYEENLLELTIRAVDWTTKDQADGGVDLLTPVVKNVVRDAADTYAALVVPDYLLVDENGNTANVFTRPFTATRTDNELIFYYKKAEGNLLVRYVDEYVKDGNTVEVELAREYLTLTANEPTSIPIPTTPQYTGDLELPAYYRSRTGQTAASRTFNGKDKPDEVVYYFTRATEEVTLQAVDSVTGEPILDGGQPVEVQFDARAEEYVDYQTQRDALTAKLPANQDYEPVYQASTVTYVKYNGTDNTVEIPYLPAKGDYVLVEIYATAIGAGNLLYSYTIPAMSGEEVSLTEGQLPQLTGYSLDQQQTPEASLKATAGADNDGWKIQAVMKDLHIYITVNAEPTAAVTGAGLSNPVVVQQELSGANVFVTVPYLAGYTLKSYASAVVAGGQAQDGTGLSKIPLGTLTAGTTLQLTYVKLEDMVDTGYVTIAVEGVYYDDPENKTGKHELYSYGIRILRSDTLTHDVYEFDLSPGWALVGDDCQTVPLDDNQEVTFVYTNNLTKVTVSTYEYRADGVYDTAATLIDPIVLTNVEMNDLPFLYLPPVIPGYELVNEAGIKVDNIEAAKLTTLVESNNPIRFLYRKATGNVKATLLDADTSLSAADRLLGEAWYEVALGETVKIEPPVLDFYEKITAERWQPVTNDGSREIYEIEYLYDRKTQLVTLYAFDRVQKNRLTEDGDPTSAIVVSSTLQRVMEPYPYGGHISNLWGKLSSNGYTGYELISSTANASTVVRERREDNDIDIYFEPPKVNQIPVYVYEAEGPAEADIGDLVHTYYLPLANEDEVALLENHKPNLGEIGYVINWDHPANIKEAKATETVGEQSFMRLMADSLFVDIDIYTKTKAGLADNPAGRYRVIGGKDQEVTVPYVPNNVAQGYYVLEDGQPVAGGGSAENPLPIPGSVIELEEITTDTEIIVTYKSLDDVIDESLTTLTVISKLAGSEGERAGEELSRYTTVVRKDQEATATAPDIAGYELDQTDDRNFGNPADTSTLGAVPRPIGDSDAGYEYEFFYVSTEETVTIETLAYSEADDAYVVVDSRQITGKVGDLLTIVAPVVTGYELEDPTDSSATHLVVDPATVGSDPEAQAVANLVQFKYQRLSGNVLVQLIDAEEETVLAQRSYHNYAADTTVEQVKADLASAAVNSNALPETPVGWLPWKAADVVVTVPATATAVQDDELLILRYPLQKDLREVTIYFKDAAKKDDPTAPELEKVVKKYQYNTTVTLLAEPDTIGPEWVLAGKPYFDFRLDPQEAEPYEYTFYYSDKEEAGVGRIIAIGFEGNRAIHYADVTPDPEKYQPGDLVPIYPPTVEGWTALDPDVAVKVEYLKEGNIVKFYYKQETKPISVYLEDEKGGLLPGMSSKLYKEYDVQTYHDFLVVAPSVADYQLRPDLSSATGGAVVTTNGAVQFTNIQSAQTVTFVYQDSDSVVDETYAEITIRGLMDVPELNKQNPADQHILFAYTKRVAKDPDQAVVVVDPDYDLYGFKPAWKLQSNIDPALLKFAVTEDEYTLDFLYESQLRKIEIILQDEAGVSIASPTYQDAYVTEKITVMAPYLANYQLVSNYTKEVEVQDVPDQEAGENQAVFQYRKLDGNVFVQLMAPDGTIISQYDLAGRGFDYGVGTLLPEVLADQADWLDAEPPYGWLWTGVNDTPRRDENKSTDNLFPLQPERPATLVYSLKPDEREITVLHLDEDDQPVAVQNEEATFSGQVGNEVTAVADPVFANFSGGYARIDEPYITRQVSDDDRENVFVFYYAEDPSGIGLITVVGLDEDEKGIYYKDEDLTGQTVGKTVNIPVPPVGGYEFDKPLESSPGTWNEALQRIEIEIKEYPQQVRYQYKENWVEIPVHATDKDGRQLTGVTYKAYEDPVLGSVTADESTVYRLDRYRRDSVAEIVAPTIAGYGLIPEADGSIRDSITVPKVGAVDQPKIEFRYQDIATNYTRLTVYSKLADSEGARAGERLSQYVTQVRKEETALAIAPGIAGYELDENDPRNFGDFGDPTTKGYVPRPIGSDEAGYEYEFFYVSNEETVTIEALAYSEAEGDYLVVDSRQIAGKVGDLLTIVAPVVTGYELEDPTASATTHLVVDPTAADPDPRAQAAANLVQFKYQRLSGNVLVQLIDAEDEQILAQQSYNNYVADTKVSEIMADLASTDPGANALPVTPVGWEDWNEADDVRLAPATATAVMDDELLILRYPLQKDRRDVTIYFKDAATKDDPTAPELEKVVEQYQYNTTVTLLAEPRTIGPEWVLLGNPYQDFRLNPQVAEPYEFTFYYSDKEEDGVGRIIAIGFEGNRAIHYADVTPDPEEYQPGDLVPVYPPTVEGWTALDPDVAVDVEYLKEGNIVKFYYRQETKTISVYLQDAETGAALPDPDETLYKELAQKLYQAYAVQTYTDFLVVAPRVAGYELLPEASTASGEVNVTTTGTVQYTKLLTDQTVTFVYQPIAANYTTVTLYGYELARDSQVGDGEPTGGAEIFRQTTLLENAAGGKLIDAPNLPGYTFAAGETGTWQADLQGGTETHNFYYVKDEGRIVATFRDGDGEKLAEDQEIFAPAHSTITVNAKVIADYELANPADISQPATADPTQTTTVEFVYQLMEGKVLFLYVSGDADDTGTLLAQTSDSVAATTPTAALEPSRPVQLPKGWQLLEGENARSVSHDEVQADGSAVITIKATKIMVPISAVYYDVADGSFDATGQVWTPDASAQPIATHRTSNMRGQLAQDLYVLADPQNLPPGYVLAPGRTPYQHLTVGAEATDNVVYFLYEDKRELGAGALTIIGLDYAQTSLGGGATTSKQPLYYIIADPIGEKQPYEAVALDPFLGWDLLKHDETSDPVSGTMVAGGVTVRYLYGASLLDVQRYVEDSEGQVIESAWDLYEKPTELLFDTRKQQAGESVVVAAPHIENYQLLEAKLTEGSRGVPLSDGSIYYDTLATAERITFRYENIDEIVDDRHTTVTLTGLGTDGKDLYSTESRLANQAEAKLLPAPNVVGYVLDPSRAENYAEDPENSGAGQFGYYRATLQGGEQSHTFYYKLDQGAVTARYVDEHGQELAASQTFYAPANTSVTVNAKVIDGYQLHDPEQITQSALAPADGEKKLTFTYVPMNGNVLFLYMSAEDDVSKGQVLVHQRQTEEVGALTADLEPEPAMSLPKGWELMTKPDGSLDIDYSHHEVQTDGTTTITYYAVKIWREITVSYCDPDGLPIDGVTHQEKPLLGQLEQDVYVFADPQGMPAGYVLTEAPYKLHPVASNSADNEVRFTYEYRGGLGAGAVTTIGLSAALTPIGGVESRRPLYYLVDDPIAEGEDYTTSPLARIDGWSNPQHDEGSDDPAGTMKAGGVIVRYLYENTGKVTPNDQIRVKLEGWLEGTEESDGPYYTSKELVTRAEDGPTVITLTYGREIRNLLPTYELVIDEEDTGWSQEDGAELVYTRSIAADDPAQEITIPFWYRNNLTSVTVTAYEYPAEDWNGQEEELIVLETIRVTGVVLGSIYTHNAPAIPGYVLVYEPKAEENAGLPRFDYTGTLGTVSSAHNKLAFYYRPIAESLNQRVEQVDENGQLIGVYYTMVEAPRTTLIPEPLAYYETVSEAHTVEWDGISPLETVVFTYQRYTRDVTLLAFDVQDLKNPLKDEQGKEIKVILKDLPVMTTVDYNEEHQGMAKLLREIETRLNDSYSPITPENGTKVYVELDAQKNIIPVLFRSPEPGRIAAEVWLDVNNSSPTDGFAGVQEDYQYLYTYYVTAHAGRPTRLEEADLPDLGRQGYQANARKSQLVAQDASSHEEGVADHFTIVADDKRLTVAAVTVVEGACETVATHKVVSGNRQEVATPRLYGYVLDTYRIDVGAIAGKEQPGENVISVSIPKVTDDTTVTFTYQPLGGTTDPDDFVKVDVRGIDRAGNELYRQEPLRLEKGQSHEVVHTPQEGYRLLYAYIDGKKQEVTDGVTVIAVDETEVSVEFVYAENYNSEVVIRLLEDDGTLVDTYLVEATSGEPFSYSAPHLRGYYLGGVMIGEGAAGEPAAGANDGELQWVDTSIGYLESVSANKDSRITFVYIKGNDGSNGGAGSPGSVIVTAKEWSPDEILGGSAAATGEFAAMTGAQATGKADDAEAVIRVMEVAVRERDGNYVIAASDLDLSRDYYTLYEADLDSLKVSGGAEVEPEEEPEVEPEEEPAVEPDQATVDPDEEGVTTPTAEPEPGAEEGPEEKPEEKPEERSESDQDSESEASPEAGLVSEPDDTSGTEADLSVDDEATASAAVEVAVNAQVNGLGNGQTVLLIGSAGPVSRSGLRKAATLTTSSAGDIIIDGYDPENQYEITVYYTKDLQKIIVITTDAGDGRQIGETDQHVYGRKGEVTEVDAPRISGYRLLSPTKGYVRVRALDEAEAEFSYLQESGSENTASLEIKVRNDKGGIIANTAVTVIVTDAAGNQVLPEGRSLVNGSLKLEGLALGDYKVTASASGYVTSTVEVSLTAYPYDKEVILNLAKAGGGGSGSGGGGNNNNNQDPDPELPEEEEEELIASELAELLALLRNGDHIAYLSGYPGGTVRPDASITRAETAQLFYQLLQPYLNESFTIGGRQVTPVNRSYRDVADGEWYTNAISTLSAYGILSGYPDGAFRPDDEITRAEFTVIVSQLAALLSGNHGFADAAGHWAETYITNAAVRGWVSGYPDGTFRPEADITRGEAVSILNRMLERQIHKEDIPVGARQFTDLTSSHWAYEAIVEAANAHDHERQADGYELWSNVR